MLHGCCSGVSQSPELGSQERLDKLKFECWTKVTHWSPCPALAMCLSVLLYHRHETALSVWLLQLSSAGSLKHDWDHSVHCQEMHETGELWFEILWEGEGWTDMLVPDWIAQKSCAWTCLNISIFLTVAAAHQIRFKCLKSLHSASWDEVFPQSRDLKSVSAAFEELNTWTETQIVPVLWTEKEICFHQVFSMLFFPLKLDFCVASGSGIVAHLLPADFPCTCWQGLHHLGNEWWRRVTSEASAHCFSLHCLPRSSHDLWQMLSRFWRVGMMVFPVPICCMCCTLTHQENWPERAFSTLC